MRLKLFALVLSLMCVVSLSQILGEAQVFAQYVDTAWVRRYNGPANSFDGAWALAMDGSGNIYVTGQSIGSGTSDDYATIKYLPNGDTAWVRRYNGPGNAGDNGHAIAVDGSGNVCVTGESFGSGANYDYATIKYLPNGDTAWDRRYNGPGNATDVAVRLAVDGFGNVYVTGHSYSGTSDDYATIKYLPNGDTAWVRRYNGPANDFDEARALAVDGSGNVYVIGGSYGSGTGTDCATIKYLPNGDTAWVRRYNGPANANDVAHRLALDDSGNVYVIGYSFGSGTDYDYATIKYLPTGDTAWLRRYNGPGNSGDKAYNLALDGSENVYVTGYSFGSGTNADYATIKYLPTGDIAWVRRYNGPGNEYDESGTIALDDSGNVYVIGYSFGSGTDYDYATIKYIQFDSIPFAPAVNYPLGVGDSPSSVFCADLDGDNDLDLAVANSATDNVSILKNNGDGTFASAENFGAGDGPYALFCADLDGDNDPDLAVANYWSNNVSILKNNGDGSFGSVVSYGAGDGPHSVFCADLDGDLNLDLAVSNALSDSISILKNDGDGTFTSAVNYGAIYAPWSVFCADLDGDNDRDLAVANYGSNNVSILKNNGDGSFASAVSYGAGYGVWSVFCADLDGDLDLDLAVANYNSDNVSILKNNGDGTFASAVDYGTGDDPHAVYCADLDGDQDLDLVVANSASDNVSILKNNGDGTFASAVNSGAGDGPYSIFCADLDGDGDFDLATTNYWGDNVSILENLTQVPANQPPWAFSLISPADQDTIFGSIMFRWQTPYDPNFGDQLRYDLFISPDPDFEMPYVDSNLTVSMITKRLEPVTHWWKVKAKDNWGAETWSSQIWSTTFSYLTDSLRVFAFSPVDLIVTDPLGDSISLNFNSILDASYDTTLDYNHDGDKDDIITLPNRLVGDYTIRVIAEPVVDKATYSLGIRIDGGADVMLVQGHSEPGAGEADTFHYGAPEFLRGDANNNWTIELGDVVYLITYLYKNGPAPDPLDAGDVNCSGLVELGDIVYLITYLYKGGPPPSC